MTTLLTAEDLERFRAGTHCELHRVLGAHRETQSRVHFAVWAPGAKGVSVMGEWNGWDPGACPLQARWDGTCYGTGH